MVPPASETGSNSQALENKHKAAQPLQSRANASGRQAQLATESNKNQGATGPGAELGEQMDHEKAICTFSSKH